MSNREKIVLAVVAAITFVVVYTISQLTFERRQRRYHTWRRF